MSKLEIIKTGEWSSPFAQVLEQAFLSAEQTDSKLSDFVTNMSGMSGRKYRVLINRLIEKMPDARYLEIGSWRGSTACSAIDGNTVKALCIDSWNEGNDIRTDFLNNTQRVKNSNSIIDSIKSDFADIDYTSIGKYNVYMFDGPHEKQDQYNGIAFALPALDDTYILIVDDYNASQVQEGTEEALAMLNQTVVASIKILSHENPYLRRSDWHNGYFIAVIKK